MKFEEMLQPLRDGKKIREKHWIPKNQYLQFVESEGRVLSFIDGKCDGNNPSIALWGILEDDWELYEEPILTESERDYLSAVIRPFRDRNVRIIKRSHTNYETIIIYINGVLDIPDAIYFPMFKRDTMYKGMEVGKFYTLEELGL